MPAAAQFLSVRRPRRARKGRKRMIPAVHLPEDLLDHVISFLPVKQAAGLSQLSTRFRYSWRKSQDLCFDRQFTKHRGKSELIKAINLIFRLNSAEKIRRFTLAVNPAQILGSIYGWITQAVARSVEEMDIDFSVAMWHVTFPFYLIDFESKESIRVLRLNNCLFHLPDEKFTCLRFLRTLVLQKLRGEELFGELLDAVFSNCLMLKELEFIKCSSMGRLKINGTLRFKVLRVVNCVRIDCIKIRAFGLRVLHYHGEPTIIKFESKVMCLSDVIFNFSASRNFRPVVVKRELMASICFVRVLTISSAFMEGLSQKYLDGELREVSYSLCNVKEVFMPIGLTSFINLLDIASFVKRCPYMESLFIEINGDFGFGESQYWRRHGKERFEQCEGTFPNLKVIKIKSRSFRPTEVELVKFFLQRAEQLENFVLVLPASYHSLVHESQSVGHFITASPDAKLELYDYMDDKDCIQPKHRETSLTNGVIVKV